MYKREVAKRIAELFPLYPPVDFDYAHENPHSPWRVGFHSEYSASLKQKLIASLISEMLDCTLQTALKKIPENIDYGANPNRIDTENIRFCSQEIGLWASYIEAPQSSEIEGTFASGLALCRVPHSFKCLLSNANRGYLYETMAIARHILELVGWAHAVRAIPTLEEAEKIVPQKTIAALNRIYPKAGKLYGYLSEHSHFMPHKHEQHVSIVEEKVGTISQSVLYKGHSLALSLTLLDIICVVRDIYYCKNLRKSPYIASRRPTRLKQRRPTKGQIAKMKRVWPAEDDEFSEICGLIA